jgi:hypothetical protein
MPGIKRGWFAWERAKQRAPNHGHRIETLVGARREHVLDLVRFERAVRGADPGDRLIIAEGHAQSLPTSRIIRVHAPELVEAASTHPLVQQFSLSPEEILDLISDARRLKMAVRGWFAEEHLRNQLARTPEVTSCERIDDEGAPDLCVSWRGGPPLYIECKNVGRTPTKEGYPRIDFQRTRASKADPCSRYYRSDDFDIVAACLHGATNRWEFRYVIPVVLPAHKTCEGRVSSSVKVDSQWMSEPAEVFRQAYAARGVTELARGIRTGG